VPREFHLDKTHFFFLLLNKLQARLVWDSQRELGHPGSKSDAHVFPLSEWEWGLCTLIWKKIKIKNVYVNLFNANKTHMKLPPRLTSDYLFHNSETTISSNFLTLVSRPNAAVAKALKWENQRASGFQIGPVLLVMFRLVSAYFSLFSLTKYYWISRNQPAFPPAEPAHCEIFLEKFM
jgi:hypothetical protein